ncbi:MAG: ribosome-associated translation inhibitor RaiA [Deltaproteobacteria bacterium]|nr:ribosome-associated translation inhibitor RaiA [Deltaproteobacteria bacterium]
MNGEPRIISTNVTFRNMEGSEALKHYVTEKISHCLRKFARQDLEVNIVLSVEKIRQIAEVTFNYDGNVIRNSEESDDMYKSIDNLIDSLTNQLRKHKEKTIRRY